MLFTFLPFTIFDITKNQTETLYKIFGGHCLERLFLIGYTLIMQLPARPGNNSYTAKFSIHNQGEVLRCDRMTTYGELERSRYVYQEDTE